MPDQLSATAEFFRTNLFAWAAANPRPMPWKGEKDPYKIWLSEIILQQTRVEQGWPYFEKFVQHYPDVTALANAPEDAVLKMWEGLGYYSRARNLHSAAKYVAYQLGGKFPDSFSGLQQLKGVGDYTAAAIASFAFNLPHAVLDGNVYRVLSRFFAIETSTDTPAAKKQFTTLANQLLDPARPGAFNQAMMDFGATWCTPAQPKCQGCPLQPKCQAAQQQNVEKYPVKAKKMAKKTRYFLYVYLHHEGETMVRKRQGKDIWNGLYEFPMLEVESAADLKPETVQQQFSADIWPEKAVWMKSSPQFKQILTHQLIVAVFLELHLPRETNRNLFKHNLFCDGIITTALDVKKKFAFPRVIVRFFDKNV
jgi:A/G-specific adenine glycosylase